MRRGKKVIANDCPRLKMQRPAKSDGRKSRGPHESYTSCVRLYRFGWHIFPFRVLPYIRRFNRSRPHETHALRRRVLARLIQGSPP